MKEFVQVFGEVKRRGHGFDVRCGKICRKQRMPMVLLMQRTDANGVVDSAAAAAHGFVR
jgi:hypothetical protein